METTKLRRFAQYARRTLLELVAARLQLVLQPESAARRENLLAVKQLEKQIQDHGREQVIDRVAYTWFNRFCALRFMDVNGVHPHQRRLAAGRAVPAGDSGRGQDGPYR